MSWQEILKNAEDYIEDLIEEEREIRSSLIALEIIRKKQINELLGSELNEADLEEMTILQESSKGEVDKMYDTYDEQLNLIKKIKQDMKYFYSLSQKVNQNLRNELLDLIQLDYIIGETENVMR